MLAGPEQAAGLPTPAESERAGCETAPAGRSGERGAEVSVMRHTRSDCPPAQECKDAVY